MTDRNTWKTGFSFGCCSLPKLQRVAAGGIQAVEVSEMEDGFDRNVWKQIPQWERETGVKAWSYHLPYYFYDERGSVDISSLSSEKWKMVKECTVPMIEGCGEAGIKYLVIHPSMDLRPEDDRQARFDITVEHLGYFSDIAKKNGCVLCVENLPRTCLGNTSDEMMQFMKSNSNLRICFDVNHLMQETHEEFVRKMGDYIVTTHISDYDYTNEQHWFPMQGQINWRTVQTVLELADYNGPFIYETMPLGYTWEDVRPNHDMLKSLVMRPGL